MHRLKYINFKMFCQEIMINFKKMSVFAEEGEIILGERGIWEGWERLIERPYFQDQRTAGANTWRRKSIPGKTKARRRDRACHVPGIMGRWKAGVG